ncbi:MAG: DUF58 domain-containing protein [Phycisphaerae bacterium]
MPASRKYLDAEAIARLRGLELRARAIVAGFISGMHRSAYRGYSVEFAEHRQYVPGDDIRHIDWRVFGRADRMYIKQFEEETNLRCNLLVDMSHSMLYGSGPLNKFDYAATLAACFAYLLIHQNDAAGLITFDSQVRSRLHCTTGRGHLLDLLAVLAETRPAGQTDVKILFHRLAEELQHRSTVVLLSDLLTDVDDLLGGIEHICLAGHELVVFHVLDRDEWSFPFAENVFFEGLEDDVKLLADPQSLRASYLNAVQRFTTRVRAVCLKHGADYVPVNTHDPLSGVLSGFLAKRAGRAAGARR